MSEARITYQCVDTEYVRTDSTNKPWYRAVIVTNDTDPDPANIDPAEIKGFPRNAGFAAGSMILYPEDQHKIVYTDLSMTPAPGPEEEDVMIINLTYDSTAKTLTMDKTYAEIAAAIQGGKIARTLVDFGEDTDHMYWYGTVDALMPGNGVIEDAILVTMVEQENWETVEVLQYYQSTEPGSYPVCTLPAGE